MNCRFGARWLAQLRHGILANPSLSLSMRFETVFGSVKELNQAQENKELALTVLEQYPKIDKDGWLEYFYG